MKKIAFNAKEIQYVDLWEALDVGRLKNTTLYI